MELPLILVAILAFVAACVAIAASSARQRRPPLRTRREEDIIREDEEALIRTLRPMRANPIDRKTEIIDLDPIGKERGTDPEFGGSRASDSQDPSEANRMDDSARQRR